MSCYGEDGVHPLVDQEAPEFILKNLNGKEVSLGSLKGKVVLLHFFATFSQPSLRQLPQLEELHRKHKKRGLVVIGLTFEKKADKLQAFVQAQQLSYPILPGAREVWKKYKVGQLPDVCLIDREGVVRRFLIGFHPSHEAKVEADLEDLLRPLAPMGNR